MISLSFPGKVNEPSNSIVGLHHGDELTLGLMLKKSIALLLLRA